MDVISTKRGYLVLDIASISSYSQLIVNYVNEHGILFHLTKEQKIIFEAFSRKEPM